MLQICLKKTKHGGGVLACNKKFVSESFKDVVNVLEKFFGNYLEISVSFDKNFKHINTIHTLEYIHTIH